MARNLTTGMVAGVTAPLILPALFYEGEFGSGTVRMWTGIGSIQWNGQTWVGAGQMLGFSAIGETSDTRALGMEVSLSGAISSLISLAIGQAQQGLPGRVYLGFLEPATDYTLDGKDFSAASWTREGMRAFGSGSVVNDAVAPDGTTTMDKFVEDTGTQYHRFAQGYQLPLDRRYKSEIYVKRNASGSARDCALQITEGNANYILQRFNLGTGALGTPEISGNGALLDTGIENVGGGIYRIWLDGVANSANPALGVQGYFYQTLTDGDFDYTGDNASGLTVWNATFGFADGSYRLIADPVKAFEGRLDTPDIDDDGASSRIALNYESRLIDLDRRRERRYTTEDQRLEYSADMGFDFVPSLQDVNVWWGRHSPEQKAQVNAILAARRWGGAKFF